MNGCVITIAREYGSGGSDLGKLLAKRLGFDFYDREIIRLASLGSGISEELFNRADEKTRRSPLFGAVQSAFKGDLIPASPSERDYLSQDNLFKLTAHIIRSLANDGGCIIVGRCGEFILRERTDVFKVFVHADIETRVRNTAVKERLTPDEARKLVIEKTRKRDEYHRYFQGADWRDVSHYDLSLNTASTELETCADIIEAALKAGGHLR
ncbi:MAG: cytidylate kinase-like family protein [Eubacteriales bacterium]|nr:cytidylate kinase-like family protein [Eubacteriales bacterium]MDD3881199.1 cytidylate kinase-like family protein [Eubacteriales bacterium]MDD4511581.1 cytidylate kinase-like family protein [Eubacteriales bacterium]